MSTDFYSNIWNYDLENSVQQFEFTKEDFQKIGRIVNADDFQDMESGDILNSLLKELRIVPFGAYLKRYLYLEIGCSTPYSEVEDAFYIDLLLANFKENHVPFHMDESTTSPRRMAERWLKQSTVSRMVVFLLGFGLRMRTETVSEFLQKVLQEEDFNFEDPREVIFWYCYEHQLPFAFAQEKLCDFENYKPIAKKHFVSWRSIIGRGEYRKHPTTCLEKYLRQLKMIENNPVSADAHEVFLRLYNSVCNQIQKNRLGETGGYKKLNGRKQLPSEMTIMPADVERELYAGIPRNKDGNLKKASLSKLASFMNAHYLSRQRIEKLLSGKYRVRRFDILNLCFYIYASEKNTNLSFKERFLAFVQAVNKCLEQCHMYQLNPSNPSEAFMMICMFTEMPLITYSDVLELSFSQREEQA